MAEDFGSSVIDSAMPATDSSAVDTSTTAEVSTPETTTDISTQETTQETTDSETSTDSDLNEDGTERTPEQKAEQLAKTASADKTPAEIRSLLKQMRDADPKNAAAVRQLHGAFERYEASRQVFPGGVNEMKDTKAFLAELAGVEAGKPVTLQQAKDSIASLKSVVENANASDQLLYGDKKAGAELINNVVEDLRTQGKIENLGHLTNSMLSSLSKESPEGYAKVAIPFLTSQLRDAGFTKVVNEMHALATQSGDTAMASKVAALGNWYNSLTDSIESDEQAEEQKGQKAWEVEKAEHATKAAQDFKNSVANSAEKTNNNLLGKELGPFLRMPYFQGYGKENLMPLGNQIKADLYATLKADTAYQTQMKGMWSAKEPNRQKIEEYHKARIQSIASTIVRNAVQKMYPGYAKGGAAAGRVAAAAAAKATATTAMSGSRVTKAQMENVNFKLPKPVYVARRPENLARDVKGADVMQIMGRGMLLNKDGSYTHITWRKQ